MRDLDHNYAIVLGALLRFLRKYRQKTIKEVAKETGIYTTHISEYELGRKLPGLKILSRICKVLDYPVWKIIKKTEIRLEELGNEQSGLVSVGTQ